MTDGGHPGLRSAPGHRRIGYVLKRYPRISETFVTAEILELERQGQHVTVFAVNTPDEPFVHPFVAGVRAPVVYLPHRPLRQPRRVARAMVRAVRAGPGRFVRLAAASLWPPRVAGMRRLLQAAVLRDEMAAAGITHAHAHFASAAARLANLAFRMGGPSYSVTAHAKDVWHEEVDLDHLRDKLGEATFVATVSGTNQAYLRRVLGPGAPPVHLVPNSVAAEHLVPAPPDQREPNLVVTVARLVEKKGIGDLVAACALVPCRLEVIGDGPLRDDLEAAAASGGVHAEFARARPHDEVVSRVSRAAVFCLPAVVASTGDRDGLPTAVLEAMALGVPVVTTAVNGLAEAVVHEETGLVVPEHDPEAVAAAIARLLNDPALARRLAAAARRRVEERFLLAANVARLCALFPGEPMAPVPLRP